MTTRRPLADTAGAASYTGLTARFIRRRVELGEIPYVKVGRLVRFDLDDLDGWLDGQRIEPHDEARTG